MSRSAALRRLLIPLAVAAGLAACGGTTADDPGGDAVRTTTTVGLDSCAADAVGTLTIATNEEVNEPWFEDGDPASGGGMQGGLAVALAERLGYGPDDLEWTTAEVDDLTVDVDADLIVGGLSDRTNQYGVDLSDTTYYEVPLALVGKAGDPEVAGPLASLADLELGTVGDPALAADISASLDLAAAPADLGPLVDALDALDGGEVDALVVPLPTALGLERGDPSTAVLGQFPPSGQGPELGIGIVEGSDLGPCVDAALQALIDDGTVAGLQERWMGEELAPLLPTS